MWLKWCINDKMTEQHINGTDGKHHSFFSLISNAVFALYGHLDVQQQATLSLFFSLLKLL